MKAQMGTEARLTAFRKAETDLCTNILWLVLRMPALHAKVPSILPDLDPLELRPLVEAALRQIDGMPGAIVEHVSALDAATSADIAADEVERLAAIARDPWMPARLAAAI